MRAFDPVICNRLKKKKAGSSRLMTVAEPKISMAKQDSFAPF